MASPAFTINTSTAPPSKSVGVGAAVTLALVSIDGVRSCTWSIVATDETKSASDYTLTPSGSVNQTCTTTALTAGTAATVRATINGGIDPQTEQPSDAMHAEAKFYVPTADGFEVLCADEQNDDNRVSSATHGMVTPVNAAIRVMAAGSTYLIGPAAPSVAHTLVSFDATLDARHTEQAAGITHSGGVLTATAFAHGAIPATAGGFRLSKDTYVTSRNGGDTGNVDLIGFDSGDDAVHVGHPTTYDTYVDGNAVLLYGTTSSAVRVGADGLTVTATSAGLTLPLTVTKSNIGSTLTAGVTRKNDTAATVGQRQDAPAEFAEYQAWNTGGGATYKLERYEYGWSINGNPPIAIYTWGWKRAGGAAVPGLNLLDLNGTPNLQLGDVMGTNTQWGLTGFQQSSKTDASSSTWSVTGQETTDGGAPGAYTAQHVGLIGGPGSGATHTGGNAFLRPGPGAAATGTVRLEDSGGTPVLTVAAASVSIVQPTTITKTAIGVAQTMGELVTNSTAATNVAEQWSPYQGVAGQAWNTNGGGATEEQRWFWQEQSAQGNPSTSALAYYNQRAAGTPAPRVKFGSDGSLHVANVSTWQQAITADSGSNRIYFGAATVATGTITVLANTQITAQVGATTKLVVTANGMQIGTATDFGGGTTNILGIDDCGAAPGSNPTAGVIIYSEGGAAKCRGASATVTTFGPAEPHCPRCGRDCAGEWRNGKDGWHLAVCMWCLTDALDGAGVIVKEQAA